MPIKKKKKSNKAALGWYEKHLEKAAKKKIPVTGALDKDIRMGMKNSSLILIDVVHVGIWQVSMHAPSYFLRFCQEFSLENILKAVDKKLTPEKLPVEINTAHDLYAFFHNFDIHGFFIHCEKGMDQYLSFSPISVEMGLHKIIKDAIRFNKSASGTYVGNRMPYNYQKKLLGTTAKYEGSHKKFFNDKELMVATPEWSILTGKKQFEKALAEIDNPDKIADFTYPFTLREVEDAE